MPQFIPVDHDPFADTAPSAGPKFIPVDHDPFAEEPKHGVAVDAAKSLASGMVGGITAIPGLIGTGFNAVNQGGTWLVTKGAEKAGLMSPETGQGIRDEAAKDTYGGVQGSQDAFKGVVKETTGVNTDYTPQHTLGNFAKTTGEFIPQAAMGGGGVVRNIVTQGIIPGVASEAAGEAAAGTRYEGAARIGAALITGGTAAYLSQPRTALDIIRKAMPNVTDEQLMRADGLMRHAAARNNPLSFAEAIEQVTNGGTRVADLQRVVENSTQGGPVLKEFNAGRPEANARMAGEQFDAIAPANTAPTEIAPRVQTAAQGELDATRQDINAQARPHYDASRSDLLAPQDMAGLMQQPGYEAALRRVRGSEIQDPAIANLPDNSIGVVDAVKKELDAMHAQRTNPMSESANLREADLIGGTRSSATGAADAISPDYAEARRIGAEGRQNVLNPLERSPTGQLAATDQFADQAKIIFNPNPLPNSEGQVAAAVKAVAQRDPQAASDLVRTYTEQVFNEANQRLQGGANQAGGAKFAAQVAGNDQQLANLEAAVRALPGGDAKWEGMRQMLDIFQAQGRRKAEGSATAFNQQIQKDLEAGGNIGTVASTIASPGKLATVAGDAYKRMRYGANNRSIAEVLTDPNAVDRIMNDTGMPRQAAQALLRTIMSGAAADRTAGTERR